MGSELQRKAAAILSIEKDSDPVVSVVKALKVRDGSPLDVPIMQFSWDKEKAMHVYLGEKPKEEKDKRKEGELVAVADSRSSKRFRDSAEKAMPSLAAETFIWKYFRGTNCCSPGIVSRSSPMWVSAPVPKRTRPARWQG